jgi:hypothetical protein
MSAVLLLTLTLSALCIIPCDEAFPAPIPVIVLSDPCEELRSRLEEVEKQLNSARAAERQARDEQPRMDQEADHLNERAASDRAQRDKVLEQAKAYRDLAQDAQDAADARAEDDWIKETDLESAARRTADAEALEEEASKLEEQIRAQEQRAEELRNRHREAQSRSEELEQTANDLRAALAGCEEGISDLSGGLAFGFKLDAAYSPNLKENVCGHADISECEIDEVAIVPVIFSEYWYAPNFGMGFTGLYTRIDAVQTWDLEAGFYPSEVDIEMTTTAIGPYAASRWGISDIASLQVALGFLYMWNSADFHSRFGDETLTEERTDNGARLDVGTSLDLMLKERFGLRFNLNYTSGGGDDTDTQVRGGLGVRVGSR